MRTLLGVLASFLFLAVAASAEDRARPATKPAAKAPVSVEQAKPQFKLNLRLPSLWSEPAKPASLKPLWGFRPIRINAENADNGDGGCVPWWACHGECDPSEGC